MINQEDEPVNLGLFATCESVYDEKTQTYIPSDTTDTFKCCLRVNAPTVNICREECTSRYGDKSDLFVTQEFDRCMLGCDNVSKFFVRNCYLSNKNAWGIYNSPYVKCAKEYNCAKLDTDKLNTDCLKKYKKEIHSCCLDNSKDITGNEEYCDIYARVNIGNMLNEDEKDIEVLIPLNIKSVDDIQKYKSLNTGDSKINKYLIIVGFICVFVTLLLLKMKF